MERYQAVFKRREKKYLLDHSQYKLLSGFLKQYMERDEYGMHTICSLYYDTDSFDIIRHSIEKPVYKEKLRVRSYGVPQKDGVVYLELKKKLKGIVYKRRTPLKYTEAERYMRSGFKPMEAQQIFNEIDWYVTQNNPKPQAVICCDRLALFGRDDPELRLTFDFRVRWRDYDLDLTKGDHGIYLVSPEQCLMEIKVDNAFPLWMSRFLSEHGIFPVSFSKYGTCYKENLIEKGGVFNVG